MSRKRRRADAQSSEDSPKAKQAETMDMWNREQERPANQDDEPKTKQAGTKDVWGSEQERPANQDDEPKTKQAGTKDVWGSEQERPANQDDEPKTKQAGKRDMWESEQEKFGPTHGMCGTGARQCQICKNAEGREVDKMIITELMSKFGLQANSFQDVTVICFQCQSEINDGAVPVLRLKKPVSRSYTGQPDGVLERSVAILGKYVNGEATPLIRSAIATSTYIVQAFTNSVRVWHNRVPELNATPLCIHKAAASVASLVIIDPTVQPVIGRTTFLNELVGLMSARKFGTEKPKVHIISTVSEEEASAVIKEAGLESLTWDSFNQFAHAGSASLETFGGIGCFLQSVFTGMDAERIFDPYRTKPVLDDAVELRQNEQERLANQDDEPKTKQAGTKDMWGSEQERPANQDDEPKTKQAGTKDMWGSEQERPANQDDEPKTKQAGTKDMWGSEQERPANQDDEPKTKQAGTRDMWGSEQERLANRDDDGT